MFYLVLSLFVFLCWKYCTAQVSGTSLCKKTLGLRSPDLNPVCSDIATDIWPSSVWHKRVRQGISHKHKLKNLIIVAALIVVLQCCYFLLWL